MPRFYDDLNINKMAEDATMHGVATVSGLILELQSSLEYDYRYLKRRRLSGRYTQNDQRIHRFALAKALAIRLLRQNLLTLERVPGMLPPENESLKPFS